MNEEEKNAMRSALINSLKSTPPVPKEEDVSPMTQTHTPEKESKRKDIRLLLSEALSDQIEKGKDQHKEVSEKRKDFAENVNKNRLQGLLRRLG